MGMCDSGPQPMRVLTVTGSAIADAIRRAIATIAAGSRNHDSIAANAAARSGDVDAWSR